jgi:hypothetical protein
LPQNVQAGESVCLIPDQGEALGLLRKYLQCKFQKPTETSSLVVLSDIDRDACTPLLATMFCMGQHVPPGKAEKYWVYRDDPSAKLGPLASNQLPEALRLLQAGTVSHHHGLTFVFKGKVAGVPCTCLWDSGATQNYIAADFVHRHHLSMSLDIRTLVLADGSRKETRGSLKAKHCRNIIVM